MFRFPLLTYTLSRKIKKYQPNNIVISSFAAVKNIHTYGKNTMLYLHSPMQYIRENYYDNLQKLRFPIKQLYIFASRYLRPWDKKTKSYDTIYFNSEYTQEVAKKLYQMK